MEARVSRKKRGSVSACWSWTLQPSLDSFLEKQGLPTLSVQKTERKRERRTLETWEGEWEGGRESSVLFKIHVIM